MHTLSAVPNGVEMSRAASHGYYCAEAKHRAGRLGPSIAVQARAAQWPVACNGVLSGPRPHQPESQPLLSPLAKGRPDSEDDTLQGANEQEVPIGSDTSNDTV